MEHKLFSKYVYQYWVDNWDENKKAIKDLIDESKFSRNSNQWFDSDRANNNNSYTDAFVKIIENELQMFMFETGIKNIDVNDVWTVRYSKGDFHPPHTHSSLGYSGILYLDYDEEEHTPVWFVNKDNNPVTDRTDYCVPDVYESGIVIAPSNTLHFTYPNTSEKYRTIVGFDIKVNE